MLTQDQIEQRIAELTRARDEFITQAQQQLLGYNVRIDELRRLIAPPQEENVTEFPKPKDDPAANA